MKRLLLVLCTLACTSPKSAYFDATGRADLLSGGVRKIEISTPKGKFHVWTKRVGNNPRIKLLTLHGGPGATHEYFRRRESNTTTTTSSARPTAISPTIRRSSSSRASSRKWSRSAARWG